MRSVGLSLAVFGLLAACGEAAEKPSALDNPDMAMAFEGVDEQSPYAGQWAAKRAECADTAQLWTIEARRMGIRPAMRFCAFDDVFVSRAPETGVATWSAEAICTAEGEESRAFVFFRINEDLREMRVTFNDSASVNLIRCRSES